MRRVGLFIVSVIIGCVAYAQADSIAVLRPATVAVTVDAGSVKSLDTYLSPLTYQGMHLRVGFERFRASRFSESWSNRVVAGLAYDNTDNPAHNNTMHTIKADFNWQLLHRWDIKTVSGLSIMAGAGIGFEGGVTYNPRNSNNVCSPLIYMNVGISGVAIYRTTLRRLPVTLRYHATIPMAGCFFLPDYDQSFYEIYHGNYQNAVNASWWGNRFDINNLLTIDLHLGTTALRIGYGNDFTTAWENNISLRHCSHSFIIGAAWESIRINPHKGLPRKVRLVSSFY
ncbi:MAG: DUF3316 domain-containing protein [Muribaculaceae bacterium]|nr:DUF3316 domain-containing protein [Muribaculaceae bacterium]